MEKCGVCNKKIHFGKTTVKCKECRVICHSFCKDKVPLPCVPCAHTPLSNLGKSKFVRKLQHLTYTYIRI